MEMETRIASVRAVDVAARRVTFVASTDAIDSYDSVIRQNFRLDRWNANPVVLFAHNQRDLPIGKGVGIKSSKRETLIEVELAPAEMNPLAEQVLKLVDGGFLRGCSIGFYPHKVSFEEIDGREVVVLDEIELLELSITPIPSNPETLAKLRARAMAGLALRAGDLVRLPTKDPAAPGAPLGTPANQRGEQKENHMDLEKENAALKAKLEQRDADVTSRDKTLTEERSLRAGLERDLAAANKTLTERDAEVKAMKDESIVREVDALVGNKISKAERDDELESARINIANFRRRMANRPNLGGGKGLVDERGQSESVLGDDVEGAKRAPATGADNQAAADEVEQELRARRAARR